MARHDLGNEEAFALLRAESQRSHRTVRDVATSIMEQQDPDRGAADVTWTPIRQAADGRTSPRSPLADRDLQP